MSARKCRWCNASLDGMRADAEHCSTSHRILDWKERNGYEPRRLPSRRSERLPNLPGLKPSARAVYALLKQRGDEGAITGELCQPAVGGIRFGGRILELREAGCGIRGVQLRPGRWRYWLTDDPFDVAVPAPAREDGPGQLPLGEAA